MDPNGEDILALFADDVNGYYEQLVSLYWHSLTAFVARRLDCPQDAEDIVQEAFIRAYIALENYTPERRRSLKVRPWLYKITWNLCCTHFGRAKLSLSTSLDNTMDGDLFEHESAQGEQPETAFEQLERRQELETLIATLPQHYGVVVNLYYFAELSYQEIADVLNQPIGTVKVHVHRGVRLLRKSLALHQIG
jgi:RNA polymerase sigma-70 factor (ECF subfamily)